jgi:hypothetical protein
MQRFTVDGVPVFVASGPEPFSAGLVFGVGRRDESFVKGGLTHLVEHLVMRAIGRTSLDCNASMEIDVTEFAATGRIDRVDDPRSVADEVRGAACAQVTGLPYASRAALLADSEAITTADVRAAAESFRANAVVAVPEGGVGAARSTPEPGVVGRRGARTGVPAAVLVERT